MKLRFYFFLIFFTFFFLFYPGDSYYTNLFAYNRPLFQKAEKQILHSETALSVPILRNFTYPEVSAEGVYVVDYPSFTPFFEKNSHQHFYPASTTKIITALVAEDIFPPQKIITVNRLEKNGQIMGLNENERITVENLLYGMLVYSGNDAAFALADTYGYDGFINLMNKKAEQLSMHDSHFANPAGFDDVNNYSSPYDLTLAARELLKNPLLAKIVSTKEITVSDADFKYSHKLVNINRLLGEIPGLRGLKTGSTDLAGESLVSFYKTDTHSFLIVVLKSYDRFTDTKTIINWINENVEYLTIKL